MCRKLSGSRRGRLSINRMVISQEKKSSGRLAFIDWTRGLAAVIMLQGHVFHSFTRNDLRPQGPYILSQFVGGLPPAIFLFLTGITFAFLMHSQERKTPSAWKRIWAALKRSRYLFLIAFLFRLQLFVFGYPTSPASEILKVDVLNCMGLAMLLLAPMAVFSSRERVRLCTIVGIVIAFLAPVVSMIDEASVPWLVRSYFFPSLNYFGFFPWASFLAFGMAVGSLIRTATSEEELNRAMLWLLGVGIGLVMLARTFSDMPYSVYATSDFWLNSPALTMIKLGVVLALLSAAYLWLNLGGTQRWSLFRQLGMTSLLVYWVHIELVYGRWFGFWKESLTVPQVVMFTVVLLALMAVLSVIRTKYTSIGSFFKAAPLPQPERASGD
jgi:uncharacterized membrane protein